MDAQTDRSLLRSYVTQRDLAAFDQLIERYQADLLRLAHALLADAHAAQDAVQEAFMRLCHEAHALLSAAGTRDSLGGWLSTVVRNHCIDQLRRRAYARMLRLHETIEQDLPSRPVIDQRADEDPLPTLLWGAVATLPPLERAAVALRYRDGMSYQDIADQLGKSTSHVGVLLHAALGRLRQTPVLRAVRS